MRPFSSLVPALCCLSLIALAGCAGGSGSSGGGGSTPTNPIPAIASVAPSSLPAGSPAQTLTVSGTGFVNGSAVTFNGTALTTTYVGPTSLQVSVTAALLADGAADNLTVTNPAPGGGSSPQVEFDVKSPTPVVTSLSPSTVSAGKPAVITVTGTGFEANSVGLWNGASRATTVVGPTSLQITLTAADTQDFGTGQITVSNPGPGGSTTPAQALLVLAPLSLTAATPASVQAGAAAQTLSLTGTGFVNGSVASLDGTSLTTSFVSSTSVQATVPSSLLASGRAAALTVTNPASAPNAGTTAPLTFDVNSPKPTLTSLSPSTLPPGQAATVTLTGTGFEANSSALWNGSARTTTYVSATSLTVALTATDLKAAGTGQLSVTNPAPGGGTTASVALPITGGSQTLTALSPSSVLQSTAASVTVTGTGFTPSTVVLLNDFVEPTIFLSSTSLQVNLQVYDLYAAGSDQIQIYDPTVNGGGSNASLTLTVVPLPYIASLSPFAITESPNATNPVTVTATGTSFATGATVQANGQALTITSQSSTQIVFQVPASDLVTAQTLVISVTNPATGDGVPAGVGTSVLNVIDPTTPFAVSPNYAPAGSPDLTITASGQNFFPDSVLQWNGVTLPTTFVNTGSLTAVVPAALLAAPGNSNVGILTPESMGQAPPTQPFTTFLSLPVNDIAWNAADGLIYATLQSIAGPGLGNSLVAIDPSTGVIKRTIFVGSEPNRLTISTDGTTAFVGLNGVGAVRQVDLVAGVAGTQFPLGGGPGIYNPPYTAINLAPLPGQANSVAVYLSNGVVTIFDSGVARPNSFTALQTYFASNNSGALAFGASASTLYAASGFNFLYALTVDASGVSGSTQLNTSGLGATLQYDNGRLYFPNGTVADAATGTTLGQFSTVATPFYSASPAQGPIWSDSSLNTAWVVVNSFSQPIQITSYNEGTFNPIASLPVNGVGFIGYSSPADLIRWGQTGLAFHTNNQLYIVQGSLVKDVSSSPADLQVTVQAPATAVTGTALPLQYQVTNVGPNTAQSATFTASLPASLTSTAITTSQGTCSGAGQFYCNLGDVATGATVTVTVSATPTTAGSFNATASINTTSYDPASANNQVTSTTVVTGPLFSAIPVIAGVSPNLVAAGSSSFTLTVNGTGFSAASTVLWNGTALPTSLVNASQLTATVDASLFPQLGWANVTVLSAPPGGGQSNAGVVNVYSLLNVSANAIIYDPFTRDLYAALPSTSQNLTGNSLVAVDPLTGHIGQPVNVGSEPNLLAETSGGSYIYIGLSGAKSLGRFNLLTQALDGTFPLTGDTYPGGPTAASGLATLPGLENSVSATGVGILDISGSTATPRPNSDLVYNDAIFPDANTAYTYDNQSTGSEFNRYTVDANGVHYVDGTTLLGTGGFFGDLAFDSGIVYSSGGGLINPATTPPSDLGTLSFGAGPYGTGLSGDTVVPYAAEKKSFNVVENDAGTLLFFLERFDTQHFIQEDQLALPNQTIGSVQHGVRWGQDGLAFVVSGGYFYSNLPSQILLLRGPFVLPAEAVANPAPALTTVGSGTVAVGSGNQYLTITGTGFLPGASVLANGIVHTTNFVDPQHLSVAIAAAELTTAGSVQVTCVNPGSPASNSLTLTVQ